jgi:NitT/TauT family transport system permease protein
VSRHAPWFAIRTELSPRRATVLKVLAFVLPLAVWSVVSYVPWLWHPLVKVVDAGDSTNRAKTRMDPAEFERQNAALVTDGKKPMVGVPANPVILPAPHEVAKAFYGAFSTAPVLRNDKWLHESLWHSIQIIFWGFITAAIVGVPVGILCGTYDFFAKLTEPFVDFIRYMPAPAFGALMVGIWGIDDGPKIAIIWIGTFFQMVLVVANTTRQIDKSLLEAAQTLGAGPGRLLGKVILPGILPGLYNDMRILLGWAWTYLIVAEMVGAASGISYFINQQGKRQVYDNVFAGIIMIGIIGLVTDQLLAILSRWLFPYVQRNKAGRRPAKNASRGARIVVQPSAPVSDRQVATTTGGL